jgi:hypothetical protein
MPSVHPFPSLTLESTLLRPVALESAAEGLSHPIAGSVAPGRSP